MGLNEQEKGRVGMKHAALSLILTRFQQQMQASGPATQGAQFAMRRGGQRAKKAGPPLAKKAARLEQFSSKASY